MKGGEKVMKKSEFEKVTLFTNNPVLPELRTYLPESAAGAIKTIQHAFQVAEEAHREGWLEIATLNYARTLRVQDVVEDAIQPIIGSDIQAELADRVRFRREQMQQLNWGGIIDL